MEQLLLLVTLISALVIGLALLALSQDRNWRLVINVPTPSHASKVILRAGGFGLLAVAFPFAMWGHGPGFGSLMWGTMISFAACAVTAALSCRPNWLRPVAHAIQAVTSRYRKVTTSRGAS